jgi:hypothetical protein
MTGPERRVRVVLGEGGRRRGQGLRAREQIEEQTEVGDALVRGLVRSQLGLALRMAVVVGLGLGSLPLLFTLFPGVFRARLFGVPLPWLLLGVGAYPFLLAVAWWYFRSAERSERDFVDIVERP